MNNQREIYEALLAGETLGAKDFIKTKVKLNESGILVDETGRESEQLFAVPSNWQIYKEPQWYENIPDGGVLCYVKNFDSQGWSILPYPITHYIEGDTHPFCCYDKWKYTKPLTKEEIQVFLSNAPEEL